MKRMFILAMLICFAAGWSCQKQDSVALQRLAQRKAELDAREKALDDREAELDQREETLAENEKAVVNLRKVPRVQPLNVARDAPQRVESDKRIQQLSLEIEPPNPGAFEVDAEKAGKDRRAQERMERQPNRPRAKKTKMSAVVASPETVLGTDSTSSTSAPAPK